MPVDVQPISSSLIGVKWKEQYASAALNRRPVGITPPGIYRGLVPTEDPGAGDRTIQIRADSAKSDHVAVYETSTGFSVNYRDDVSGDFILDLSGYSSVRVVVAMFVDYQIGVNTTATYRTYTEAEFNALPAAESEELVVLGTINVPVSGPISAGDITIENRTLASQNIQKGTTLDPPFIRNSSFELGESGATHKYSSAFWEKTSDGSSTWITTTTEAHVGLKSAELNIASGPTSAQLLQRLGVPVIENQVIFAEAYVKQAEAIASGNFQFFIEYGGADGASLSTTVTDLDSGGGDASFRKASVTVLVPAGAVTVLSAGVEAVTLNPASTGTFAYIDSVQLFIQPEDARQPYDFESAWLQALETVTCVVRDPDGDFTDRSALLTYDKDTPSGEGQVALEDQAGGIPPALNPQGRVSGLGSGLLGTLTNALKARVTAPTATGAVSTFTLMWESGETPTSASARFYTKDDGTLILTTNARWDGTNWNKDAGGVGLEAVKFTLNGGSAAGLTLETQDSGTTVWLDTAWGKFVLGADATEALQSSLGYLKLGDGLLGSDTDAEVPRITIDRAPDATNERTLAFQFVADSGYAHRVYLSGDDTNSLEITANARWDDSTNTWVRDLIFNSGKYTFGRNQFEYRYLSTAYNASPWSDGDGDGGWQLSKVTLGGGNFGVVEVGNTSPTTDSVGALRLIDGRVEFDNVGAISNPLMTEVITNELRAKNTVKAWGYWEKRGVDVGNVTIEEGYNYASSQNGGSGDLQFNLTTALNDANYAVLVTMGRRGAVSPGGPTFVQAHDLTTSNFEVAAWDDSGVSMDLNSPVGFDIFKVFWMVLGTDG